jgi:aminodeoxychorismate lyase
MIVCLNGRFVPEEDAVVSIFDRSFLYGDGLFETIRIIRGQPLLWREHLQRLQDGADHLRIQVPFPPEALRAQGQELISRNGQAEAVLRVTLSRGVGPRGYSIRQTPHPTLVLSMHPAPVFDLHPETRWKVITSSVRVHDRDPLARLKTANKLPQILARMEADLNNADEALILDQEERVLEASGANIFWETNRQLQTPPLSAPILPGIMRAEVIRWVKSLGQSVEERRPTSDELCTSDGVFLTNSVVGLVAVATIDGRAVRDSTWIQELRKIYGRTL